MCIHQYLYFTSKERKRYYFISSNQLIKQGYRKQEHYITHNKPIPSKIYSMNEIGNRKARNIKQTRN